MTSLAVGIDVGGTSVKGSAVDPATGHLRPTAARIRTPDPARIDDVIAVVAQVFEAVVGRDDALRAAPLAVAVSGDVRDGVHTSGVNLHPSWVGAPTRDLLERRLDRPVIILNDADAAGIAEVHFGAARGVRGAVVMLTFGTGIGSAIFVDGRLLPNTGLGQLPFHGEPVERLLSAVARERRGVGWHEWAADVSAYLTEIDELLRPDLMILGGGVVGSASSFWDHLDVPCEVRPAQLGSDAGIVGAALVAAEQAMA
jgi:polyphosphate glucokinase